MATIQQREGKWETRIQEKPFPAQLGPTPENTTPSPDPREVDVAIESEAWDVAVSR